MNNPAFVLAGLFIIFFYNLFSAVGEKPIPYSVDWSAVPSETPNSRNLESPYLGKCMCDVTWGACDPNCCCDDDCTDVERSNFRMCLSEKVGYLPLDFCNDDQETNKRLHVGEENYLSPRPSGYGSTCLVRVNGVTQEITPFFALPKAKLKPGLLQIDDWFKVENSKTFIVDGPISQLKRLTSRTDTPQYEYMGYLKTPIPRQDGFCMSQGRYVRFMNPIESTNCLLSGEQICVSYSTDLFENIVLAYPEYNSTSTFTSVNLVILNYTSNEILVTGLQENNIPSIYKTTLFDGVCKNAIVKIITLLEYDSNNEGLLLSNASMQLYLRDVPVNNVQGVHFETKFFRAGTKPPLNYYFGTPSYFEGAVVRVGSLVKEQNKSAISELMAGFYVPSGGRMCSAKKYRKVPFLHDVRSTGCTVSLSKEELRNVCNTDGTGSMLRNILGVGSQTSNLINYVARTNDAQTNDTTSWVKIEGLEFKDIIPNYDTIQGRCDNIYVGVHYKFVVSRVGAETNPQDIITSAFAIPIVGSWRVRNTAKVTKSAVTYQRFRFEVSFTRSDADFTAAIKRRVIAPPLFRKVDDSIFYPFKPPR